MTRTTTTTAAPGTVVRYLPDADTPGGRRWCREGMAVADQRGLLFDTYWSTGSDAHVLTDTEAETAEVLFVLDDFDELDRWRPDLGKWRTYAREDRQRITSQHGLEQRLFVRKGARPHRETVLASLREAVEEREAELRSAERDLARAREDLAALLAAPDDCSCRPSLCAREECSACSGIASWTECKALPARLGGVA